MPLSLRAARVALLYAAVLLGSTPASADEPAHELVISRSSAMRLGAERGPTVREARAPVAAAPAIHDAASPLPYPPRLTTYAGRRHGGFGSGFEIGGTVAQDVSLRGLAGARRDTADAIDRSTRTSLDKARLEGVAEALLAWLDVLEGQQLVRLRSASRADAEEIARVATARVERGVSMPVDAQLAAAEVGSAVLAELDAEGRLVTARAGLTFALGLSPSQDVVAVGDLESDDGAPAPAPLRHEHPAEVVARSSVTLAEAETNLARAHASTPITVGINFAREGTGEQFLTGTVTLPLPILDPSRFDAARQHANVLAAQARVVRVRDELARDTAVTAHERVHTREVRDALRTRVLGPLRETVRLARASYQAGTQDATTFLLVRQRLVAAEEQLGHAFAEVKRADVRHALARGTLLDEAAR